MLPICDVCGQPVERHESAAWLDSFYFQCPSLVFMLRPRHIRCSPLRAQYIIAPEFPPVVDDRPLYDKRKRDAAETARWEVAYTVAWYRLQRECGVL